MRSSGLAAESRSWTQRTAEMSATSQKPSCPTTTPEQETTRFWWKEGLKMRPLFLTTSHITYHTSRITHHTSHITHHTLLINYSPKHWSRETLHINQSFIYSRLYSSILNRSIHRILPFSNTQVGSGMRHRAVGFEDPVTHQLQWFNLRLGEIAYIPTIGLYFKLLPM
jgi:hypothetical protein